MHHDPTIDGELKFIQNDEIIPIPKHSLILTCMKPLSKVKTINVPIAIATSDNKLKSETDYGYLKFKLKIESNEYFITLPFFLKAIYDFYETQITEEQYNLLLSETKPKKRQDIFETFKHNTSDKPKKRLREYFAGSMFFEGYHMRDKLMLYGT